MNPEFWKEAQTFLQMQVVQWGLNISKALLILIAGWLAARLLARLFSNFMKRLRLDATLVTFLNSLTYAVLLVIVVVAVLGQLGVETASLIAVLGAAGLALALSLQASLGNLASGLMILSFQLFRVGDTIEVVGVRGVVQEILVFHTIISTEDGQRALIPNSKITSEVVRHRAVR